MDICLRQMSGLGRGNGHLPAADVRFGAGEWTHARRAFNELRGGMTHAWRAFDECVLFNNRLFPTANSRTRQVNRLELALCSNLECSASQCSPY